MKLRRRRSRKIKLKQLIKSKRRLSSLMSRKRRSIKRLKRSIKRLQSQQQKPKLQQNKNYLKFQRIANKLRRKMILNPNKSLHRKRQRIKIKNKLMKNPLRQLQAPKKSKNNSFPRNRTRNKLCLKRRISHLNLSKNLSTLMVMMTTMIVNKLLKRPRLKRKKPIQSQPNFQNHLSKRTRRCKLKTHR